MELLNKHVHGNPPDAVYIGRGSVFGNQKVIGVDGTRAEVIDWYRQWLRYMLINRDKDIEVAFRSLTKDSRLLCFCLPKPCHGQVIIDYWNEIHSHGDYEKGLLAFKKRYLAEKEGLNKDYRAWLEDKLISRDPKITADFRELILTHDLIPDRFAHGSGTGRVILDLYHELTQTGDYEQALSEFAKTKRAGSYFTPDKDGVDHLNVYSKARTDLGRALSNFARTPFFHQKHGEFQSIEGYWYWIATGKKHHELKDLYGHDAKKLGKTFERVQIQDFIPLIKEAMLLKFEQNPQLAEDFKRSTLPLTHYYYYGDVNNAKVIPEKSAPWFVEYLELIRQYLNGQAHKVIIAGSRGIRDLEVVRKAYLDSGFKAVQIISGHAKGVDMLGEQLAHEMQLPVKTFIPDWEDLGNAAGMIRNRLMGDYAGALVAVWDGQSPGTKGMIDYMVKLKKLVHVHRT